MNYSDIMGLTSGVLQLAVACYALRLSRRFGTERVGWLVFGAFFLLAVVHSLLALDLFHGALGPAVVADFAYVLVSILLLTSIARLETSLKKHWQNTSEQRRNLCAWETQVEAQVVELTRSNEELRKIGTKLQVEVAEQKQLREQADQTCQTLLTAARQTENDLQQTVTALQSELAGQKQLQATVRQEALAEVAASVLESVNSLSLLASDQARSRTARIVRAAKLIQKRPAHPGASTPIPGRRKLPAPLAQLVRLLSDDQSLLLQKIEALKSGLEQVKGTAATLSPLVPDPAPAGVGEPEQGTAQTSGEAKPAEKTADEFQKHLIGNTTETGTESAGQDPEAAAQDAPADTKLDSDEVRA